MKLEAAKQGESHRSGDENSGAAQHSVDEDSGMPLQETIVKPAQRKRSRCQLVGDRMIEAITMFTLSVSEGCRKRIRSSACLTFARAEKINDAGRVAAFPPELTDFAIRMTAFYLDSVSIAKTMRVDRGCNSALAMPGLVAELMGFRGLQVDIGKANNFGQLHLSENLLTEDNNISFDFMSSDISWQSGRVLDRIADLFRKHPSASGRIETHAQPGAPRDFAIRICTARAQAVCAALAHRGVHRDRLRCGGFGTSRALLGKSDHANRRAEIFIILGGMQFPAEHMPVRVEGSARWASWLRGEIGPIGTEPVIVAAYSDDESDSELDQHHELIDLAEQDLRRTLLERTGGARANAREHRAGHARLISSSEPDEDEESTSSSSGSSSGEHEDVPEAPPETNCNDMSSENGDI
eukprot:gnl/TRDRNA2_/TRDRNA2_175998_c0_seq1.p1 gnl/TRDRNA2_/TRDRNA2_175998_c0~~gnl/TRDRNA2_/TRDRNA2_175998_c0_seq1.p1  ORF type:complete len:410 (+),score=45.02 gnl/TRDRNA2_/TRDRNA2_175998_c0_seq1:35-1264(+)